MGLGVFKLLKIKQRTFCEICGTIFYYYYNYQDLAIRLPSRVTASEAAGQRRLNSSEALSTLAASATPHKLSSINKTDCFTDSLLCTVRRSFWPTTLLNLLCTDCKTYKINTF